MSVLTTATPTQQGTSPGTITRPAIYRMTVDEFERIADSLDDDHVELIDGYIVGSSEMKPSHALAAELTKRGIESVIPSSHHLREDKPVRIPDFNEPRPDFSVARLDPRAYAARHPEPGDVSLVVKIADTSLPRDRGEKWDNYARSGIPVYWLVNLVDRQIEVYSGPGPAGYATRADYQPGQRVPIVLDGMTVGHIAVDDILPG